MMQSLLFELPSNESEFADATYSILGRALAYVVEFEADFRALNMVIRLKDGLNTGQVDLDDEESIRRFFDLVLRTRLFEHIGEIVLKLRLAAKEVGAIADSEISLDEEIDYLADLFDRARKARNDIAHEVCLGIWSEEDTHEGRQRVLREVSLALVPIAEAHRVLLVIIAAATAQPVPIDRYLRTYSIRVVEWVCGSDFLNARTP